MSRLLFLQPIFMLTSDDIHNGLFAVLEF